MITLKTCVNDNIVFVDTYVKKVIAINNNLLLTKLTFRQKYERSKLNDYDSNGIQCPFNVNIDNCGLEYAPKNKLRFVNDFYKDINELFELHSDLYQIQIDQLNTTIRRTFLTENNVSNNKRYYYKIVIDRPLYKFLSFNMIKLYIDKDKLNHDINGILIDFYDLKQNINIAIKEIIYKLLKNNIKSYTELLSIIDDILQCTFQVMKINNICYKIDIHGPVFKY